MHTTSATLLERVRDPGNQEAWERFVQLYTPFFFNWAARAGLQQQDAADLVQEVFVLLLRNLPKFQYQHDGSFRGWLQRVVQNKWREIERRRAPMPILANIPGIPLANVPAPPDTDLFDETEHRNYLVQRALVLIQGDFELTTWRAWQEYAVAGRPVEEVARELKITPHAVYLSKARVLRRIREEISGFLDD